MEPSVPGPKYTTERAEPASRPRKQCGKTRATRTGLVFCVKDAGHKGKHKGFRKTWS